MHPKLIREVNCCPKSFLCPCRDPKLNYPLDPHRDSMSKLLLEKFPLDPYNSYGSPWGFFESPQGSTESSQIHFLQNMSNLNLIQKSFRKCMQIFLICISKSIKYLNIFLSIHVTWSILSLSGQLLLNRQRDWISDKCP